MTGIQQWRSIAISHTAVSEIHENMIWFEVNSTNNLALLGTLYIYKWIAISFSIIFY